MKILSAAEVDAALDDLALIDRLDALFRAGCEMPPRHHHTVAEPAGPGSAGATLLLMPAWTRGASSRLGIKLVTVFPGNASAGLPSILSESLRFGRRSSRGHAARGIAASMAPARSRVVRNGRRAKIGRAHV